MTHAVSPATVAADPGPVATLRSCSRSEAGWTSLLVRSYRNAAEAETCGPRRSTTSSSSW